jgi:hypothetical protein
LYFSQQVIPAFTRNFCRGNAENSQQDEMSQEIPAFHPLKNGGFQPE